MIIYNVTTKVDWSVADDWVQWMKDEQIPNIIGTGHFYKHQFVKLLETDDVDGPTYAVQYFALAQNDYDRYIARFAKAFSKRTIEKWGNKFISFSSLMQVLQ